MPAETQFAVAVVVIAIVAAAALVIWRLKQNGWSYEPLTSKGSVRAGAAAATAGPRFKPTPPKGPNNEHAVAVHVVSTPAASMYSMVCNRGLLM